MYFFMDARLILVGTSLLSSLVTLVLLYVLWIKLALPVVTEKIEELNKALEVAEVATRTGMSALGAKSGEVRAEGALEDDLFEAVLNRYPELEQLALMVAPDFLERIKENPKAGLALLERYAPFLEKFGMMPGSEKSDAIVYDL